MSELDIVKEGRGLIDQATACGIPLRLLGGAAIWVRAGDAARAGLGRQYPDLDFAARKRDSRRLRILLEDAGYEPERVFNAMHGANRLLYHAPQGHQIDIFLDSFVMCHRLDLCDRLEAEAWTIPAAELLLTKLQIVQINRKDIGDILMMLWDHELCAEDGPSRVNAARIETLCGADWGLFTTITDNLAKTRAMVGDLLPDRDCAAAVVNRIESLERGLQAAPKTLAWKLRSTIGRRQRWYEMPEEVVR
jgi:hypothetical protein